MKTKQQRLQDIEEALSDLRTEAACIRLELEAEAEQHTPAFLAEYDESKVKWAVTGDLRALQYASVLDRDYRNALVSRGRGFRAKADAEIFAKAERVRDALKLACVDDWAGYEIGWSRDGQLKWYINLLNRKPAVTGLKSVNNLIPLFRLRASAEKFIAEHECNLLGVY